MKERWFFIIAMPVLGALMLFFPFSGHWFQVFLQSSLRSGDLERDPAGEKDALLAQIAVLRDLKELLPGETSLYRKAFVYSRYPFNFKNEIVIDAGAGSGIREHEAVALPGEVLLGKISQVFESAAVVQTVFDSRFELPVRIGGNGVDALLKGGNEPTLTLISKQARLSDGDVVYAAARGVPYGTALGKIRSLRMSSNQLFQEGTLVPPYDLNTVRAVLVAKDTLPYGAR